MSTIKVICIDQALAFENTPVIASGGLEDDVSFTFCERWNGYTRTAVFWRNEADAYHVLLGSTDTCQLPPEVTGDEGIIYFGVFGVNGAGSQRTTQVLTYRIEKGAITVGTAPSDPTPDIYTQLLARERAFEEKIEQIVVDNTVPDGTLTTDKLADRAVTVDKLADGAVIGQKLAENTVTPEKLSSDVLAQLNKTALMPQLKIGSYVGSGENGSGGKNSLQFSFSPKIVVIVPNDANGAYSGAIFVNGQSEAAGLGDTAMRLYLTWGERAADGGYSVSWYSGLGAGAQLNTADATYYYFAIG